MKNHRKTTAALAALLVSLSLPALASAEGMNWNLEVFGGRFYGENDLDEDLGIYGLRAGRRIGEDWALELSIGELDEDLDSVDFFFVDLSARRFVRDGERTDLYLSGGVGGFLLDLPDRIFPGEDEDSFTAHLGFGLEVDFGERFYLRPEIKQRWIDSEGLDDDLHGELSVGLGIRL